MNNKFPIFVLLALPATALSSYTHQILASQHVAYFGITATTPYGLENKYQLMNS